MEEEPLLRSQNLAKWPADTQEKRYTIVFNASVRCKEGPQIATGAAGR